MFEFTGVSCKPRCLHSSPMVSPPPSFEGANCRQFDDLLVAHAQDLAGHTVRRTVSLYTCGHSAAGGDAGEARLATFKERLQPFPEVRQRHRQVLEAVRVRH